MLELKEITKVYTMAGQTKLALKDVSLNFRKNEFVSILGQSGSGKTTLLNIIGGLDQYSSGDLLINGRSTKDFKDRDWDAYRNNTIGFVFQSYNLISHQTAVSNVEMAMTLSGVSKNERRKRALEALDKVGLSEHAHKKPNQMSGGQMQRIAIARALVNNPDILLADEPTGALDSETSVQIMDLLKEIAADRLVIMVTHNPGLAKEYSTRIIQVLDGQMIGDSDPYEDEDVRVAASLFKKTKMSFWTALSLSFNNLLTKKGRTLLTGFAGSIGIIGIALILSLSNGVQAYINQVQEDTMVAYPLSIESQATDLSALMSMRMDDLAATKKGKIGTTRLISGVTSAESKKNDLKAFKAYIEAHQADFDAVTKTIQYGYAITPQIYQADTSEIRQVNPSTVVDDLETKNPAMTAMASNAELWTELVSDQTMLEAQYQLLAGQMPQDEHEVVLIADENNKISDLVLYSLGILDVAELNQGEVKADRTFDYDDLLGRSYKLVVNSSIYQKSGTTWMDKSDDKAYMAKLIKKGKDLKIVGIVKPQAGTSSGGSVAGVGYTHALTQYLVEQIEASELVKSQKANPKVNVFTGQAFPEKGKTSSFSANNLSLDEQMRLASMSPEELTQYVQQYNENANATYEENLTKLGVIDLASPSSISFYAASFEQKDNLKALIDDYSQRMKAKGHEDKALTYTDQIALIMSSVTTMIKMITYVLVGFVAISLVVSSIMIGIITYISVLERTKEIGILRAMGASKKDVTRIFTAETAIEGVLAGGMGIFTTLLLSLPINAIVERLTDVSNITSLPVEAAVALIFISVFLTVFAGILPSRVAAKKDPVEALRTE